MVENFFSFHFFCVKPKKIIVIYKHPKNYTDENKKRFY